MGIGLGIYAKNSKKAVELYCKAFGLELGYHVLNNDGSFFHSELSKDGAPFIAVAEENETFFSDCKVGGIVAVLDDETGNINENSSSESANPMNPSVNEPTRTKKHASLPYVNPVEMGYTVSSETEFYHVFETLKENGNILMEICTLPWSPLAVTVQDEFGVRWYITLPQHRPEEE